eukprot:jgi/Chlat1/6330/Chrsp44S05793
MMAAFNDSADPFLQAQRLLQDLKPASSAYEKSDDCDTWSSPAVKTAGDAEFAAPSQWQQLRTRASSLFAPGTLTPHLTFNPHLTSDSPPDWATRESWSRRSAELDLDPEVLRALRDLRSSNGGHVEDHEQVVKKKSVRWDACLEEADPVPSLDLDLELDVGLMVMEGPYSGLELPDPGLDLNVDPGPDPQLMAFGLAPASDPREVTREFMSLLLDPDTEMLSLPDEARRHVASWTANKATTLTRHKLPKPTPKQVPSKSARERERVEAAIAALRSDIQRSEEKRAKAKEKAEREREVREEEERAQRAAEEKQRLIEEEALKKAREESASAQKHKERELVQHADAHFARTRKRVSFDAVRTHAVLNARMMSRANRHWSLKAMQRAWTAWWTLILECRSLRLRLCMEAASLVWRGKLLRRCLARWAAYAHGSRQARLLHAAAPNPVKSRGAAVVGRVLGRGPAREQRAVGGEGGGVGGGGEGGVGPATTAREDRGTDPPPRRTPTAGANSYPDASSSRPRAVRLAPVASNRTRRARQLATRAQIQEQDDVRKGVGGAQAASNERQVEKVDKLGAVKRARNKTLTQRVLRAWMTYLEAVRHARHARTKQTIRAWSEVMRYERSIIEVFAERRRRSTLAGAVSAWQQWAQEEARAVRLWESEMLARVRERMQRSKLARALVAWQQAACEEASQRERDARQQQTWDKIHSWLREHREVSVWVLPHLRDCACMYACVCSRGFQKLTLLVCETSSKHSEAAEKLSSLDNSSRACCGSSADIVMYTLRNTVETLSG